MTTATKDAVNTEAEWDRLSVIVRDTPEDFASWEQLLRVTEGTAGPYSTNTPPDKVIRMENVYDDFLNTFPLCFGYWKKYADAELAIHGIEGAVKVFERGVKAVHTSIDLWNRYIETKMLHSAANDEIASLFERGAACVGLDFLGHPFWDKYIEFVETQIKDSKRLLLLLNRIVTIPMHQYARYYEKWRGLRSSISPSEAIDSVTLSVFQQEIVAEKGNSLTPEQMEAALREKMDTQTKQIYKKTQEGTNSRWVYEAEIKRTYFHVKPLDRPQLQNWSKYLDYEEAAGDIDRIRALYERCLVPCASYEEFWIRYGQWSTGENLIDGAQYAYERASNYFLPKERCGAKIALALIYEEKGDIDEARETYKKILEYMPNHIETILNHIHFERRQDASTFEPLINEYFNSDKLDTTAKAFLTVQYAKHAQQNGENDKARQIYTSSIELFNNQKYFWMNYFNFELGFHDEAAEERISTVLQHARTHLQKDKQKEINAKYREYLLERGTSVSVLNRNSIKVSTDFTTTGSTNSLKRPAEDPQPDAYKQARVDAAPAQQQAYGYAYPQQGQPQQVFPTGGYYGQQPQQQPWQ